MKSICLNYTCIVLLSVILMGCDGVTSLLQDSLEINVSKLHCNDDGTQLRWDENRIWNRNEACYETFNTNDVQSSVLQFGSKSIVVSEHRNEIIVTDAYSHGNYGKHVSGWSRRLQCAAVIPVRDANFLFVIKGYRTYHNYSRIHVFNEDFTCCCEKEIMGRSWRIMGVSSESNGTSIFLKNKENGECIKIVVATQAIEGQAPSNNKLF